MNNFSLHTVDSRVIAFNGLTYFVKFLECENSKWLPVAYMNFDVVTGEYKIKGVYGLNMGVKQDLTDNRGKSISKNMYSLHFKQSDLKVNNRIKLYNSSVKTEIIKVYGCHDQALKFNKDIDELLSFCSLIKELPVQTYYHVKTLKAINDYLSTAGIDFITVQSLLNRS